MLSEQAHLGLTALNCLTRWAPCMNNTVRRAHISKDVIFLPSSIMVIHSISYPEGLSFKSRSQYTSCRLRYPLVEEVVVVFFRTFYLYRMSQEERTKLRECVPYVKVYRYNPKHLYPKLNGYGDNGKRSLKL